jgi:O-antigen/teichoic acid export membrane protein
LARDQPKSNRFCGTGICFEKTIMSESKTKFFRQSGWLAIANTLAGVFMVAVHPVVSLLLPPAEYGLFVALLRLLTVLAIPAAGLQIVLAQKTAAAVTPEKQNELLLASRDIIRALVAIWLIIAFIFAIIQLDVIASFKITNAAALWVTLLIVLPALCLPLFQGMLQGKQDFTWLGISMISNGAGRCLFVAIIVLGLHAYAAGAMVGTLSGFIAALLAALVGLRGTFKPVSGAFDWRDWIKRLVPLTLGTGSILFLLNVDVIAVQTHFPKEVTGFYSAGATIGLGLVTFTTPMASVMFPKLVRSFATEEKSNALRLALLGTAVLGGSAALVCTIFPELPLRIMYFRTPVFWKSAVLVPWFMWCLLPVTLANVLVANLLARERFSAVPWLLLVAVSYGIVLFNYAGKAAGQEPFTAFRHIVQILGIFSTLLLAVSAFFTWRDLKRAG